jgi:transcriptional/translational regulatory protein YebC/TACO1
MEIAIEAGAEDVSTSEICCEVTTAPDSFLAVKAAVEEAGIAIESSEVTMVAANTVTVDAETARKVMRLLDALEDHDDAQSVSSNVDIPDEVAAQIAD